MEADSGRAGYDRSQRPGRLRDGPAGRFRPDRPPPVDCSRHGAHGRHQLTAPSAALRNPFISDAAAPQVPTHRPRLHVSPPPLRFCAVCLFFNVIFVVVHRSCCNMRRFSAAHWFLCGGDVFHFRFYLVSAASRTAPQSFFSIEPVLMFARYLRPSTVSSASWSVTVAMTTRVRLSSNPNACTYLLD